MNRMQAAKPLTVKETQEYWLQFAEDEADRGPFLYQPAILI